MTGIYQQIHNALIANDAFEKTRLVDQLSNFWRKSNRELGNAPVTPDIPGRPNTPELVSPNKVPRRRLGSPQGRAAMMHSVAHIEFNAINLALDMALRFGPIQEFTTDDHRADFLSDWISVAADESRHFLLVQSYLNSAGFQYGDFVAHNGLWEAAQQSAGDVATRLAIAPMVLEARGLDVTPQIIEKMKKVGDQPAVEVLEIILKEEVAHVGFGTKWFGYFAKLREKNEENYFQELVKTHFRGTLKQPFNVKARYEAQLYEEFYLPLAGIIKN